MYKVHKLFKMVQISLVAEALPQICWGLKLLTRPPSQPDKSLCILWHVNSHAFILFLPPTFVLTWRLCTQYNGIVY